MDGKNIVKNASELAEYYFPETPLTYADALRTAVKLIKKRRAERGFDPERKYMLFVPDKYTLLAEKLLYGDNAGAFDAEVLTVNRLCYKVCEYSGGEMAKPLSRLGAVLTVRRILGENESRLHCYRNSARFAGFGGIMYDNICQLASCGLRSADIPDGESGVIAEKLHDIKLVYSEFEKLTAGEYVDAAGRLMLLDRMLAVNAGFFDGAVAVFACYDGFTPLAARIVGRICSYLGRDNAVIVGAECLLDVKDKAAEEYVAPSRADELKAAAVRIRALAAGGVRYGDIGVIAPGADFNRLKRIFDEYGVPYFTDEKYALSSHPLARYLLDLFAAVKSGSNENYIKLSKNPYSGISGPDADVFENCVYALCLPEWSMDDKLEFDVSDERLEKEVETAERVRRKLHAAVRAVDKKSACGGDGFRKAVINAIPACEEEISTLYSDKFPNARGEIETAVSVLGEVFPEGTDFGKLIDALKECFAVKEVGVIPNRADTVEVGDVTAFRASGKKHLFVLGMHDGEIPAVMRDEGLLTDDDLRAIGALGEYGAEIEPSIETLNRRAERELYSVLSSSGDLFLSYCSDCAPSPVLLRVKKECGKLTASGTQAERESLMRDDGTKNADMLYYLCPTEASGAELYLIGKNDMDAGGIGYGFERELRAAIDGAPDKTIRADTVFDAGRLYRDKTSVSRIQEYFACPLRCFLRYGLRLGPRPDGQVSPLDLGTFLHRVIELFVAGGDLSDPKITVPQIVGYIRENEPETLRGASDDFVRELTDEAVYIAAVVARQLDAGSFAPKFTEAGFGKKDGAFGALALFAGDGEISVEGVIDRVDVADIGDGKYAARVVDYKTGFSEFNLSDIYYGRKIQLPIYLKVVENGGYAPAGMFYFPFSSGFAEDRNSYRLRGLFDAAYAREMDRALCEPSTASEVVAARSTKNSSFERPLLNKSGSGVDGGTLRGVCDYAEKIMGVGAQEMKQGYCAPSPLASGSRSECAYCELGAVCSAFGGEIRERNKTPVKADFILRSIGGKTEGGQ